MNKEEAKHFVRKWYLDHGLTIGGLIEAMDGMIDAINPYPEETVLPKVVGDWVGKCTGQGVPEWLLNMSMMPREVSVWLRNKGNYVDEHHQQLLMYAYLYGWVQSHSLTNCTEFTCPGQTKYTCIPTGFGLIVRST